MISTKIAKINPLNPDEGSIKEAVEILSKGGLVIIPTETVYGIAANMLNKKALERLSEIKKRTQDKPFSIHIDAKDKIEEFATGIPTVTYKLIDKFWPGPLTIVLRSKDNGTVGLRMPDNEIALRIIAEARVPLVCPSANLSGEPAPRSFQEAIKNLNGLVDLAIDAGPTKLGTESTVVDLSIEPLRILREGAIKKEDIEKVAKTKTVLFVCTGNSCRSVMAKGLLEKKLREKNRTDVEVLSAGMMMPGGLGATDPTKELLMKEGIDVLSHRSQKVTKEMLKESDLILIMEKYHEERILEIAPEAKFKLFLLKEFAKISDNHLDIEDPIGKSKEFYEETFRVIKEAIERISNLI